MKEYNRAPKLQELTPSQLETCTFMILQQPKQIKTKYNKPTMKQQKHTTKRHKHTTPMRHLQKIYNKKQYLKIHRANKPQCKLLWQIENEAQKPAQMKNAKKKFPTIAKCRTHTQYHCHRNNISKILNPITNKTIDRRTIQGRGTPKTEEKYITT